MTSYDYDLFVIGGGSGGVRAARVAASLGKKVGIAEEYRFGGTCVIRGCVPKKLFVYASHFSETFEHAAGFGWDVGESSFSWKKLIKNKDQEISRLEGLYRKGLETAGAEMFDSRAILTGANSVKLLQTGLEVTAELIIVAVGGTPNPMDDLAGSEHCITSNEAFHLDELPEKIVIQGGGYIAVEFAGIFAGMGADVTLVYRGDQILRGFDADLRDQLSQEMSGKGIEIVCGQTISSVTLDEGGKRTAELSDGRIIEADQVMQATGRLPLTEGLGLETAGVKTAPNGSIIVDEYSKTNVASIWALGDVTNRVELTPVAIHEAMCFVDTEYRGIPTKPDHQCIATAVFSQPELGTVGLTEEEASAAHSRLAVYRALFRPMKHTLSGSDEKMLMKIICDEETDKVLGVHIMGESSGEMAQTLGIALKMGATKTDFDRTMAVHPTAAEELVTMYQPSYRVENGKRVS